MELRPSDWSAQQQPFEDWATNVRNILEQIIQARNDEAYTIHATDDYSTIRITNFSRYDDEHFLCLQTVGANMDVRVHSHSLPDLLDHRTVTTATTTARPTAAGVDDDDGSESQRLQEQRQMAASMWFAPIGTIESHINTFLLYLEQMNTFYNHMHTIDELCYVVEPAVVTSKSNSRTIQIDNNIFVRIVVDPMSPSALVCTIIGPSYATGHFRELYDQRVCDWNVDVDIHQNLLRIFDMTRFPIRPTATNDGVDGGSTAAGAFSEVGCGICLEYRCDQHVPFVSCDNRNCTVVYHTQCLRDWFRSLPESRTFLDVTFGTCPYCKNKLSTSFVGLLTESG